MSESFNLDADPNRAVQLDRELRQRLATSLSYALTEFDLLEPVITPRFEAFLLTLRAAPVDPQVFGIYYDLVLSLEHGQEDAAKTLLSELLELPPPAAGIQVKSLADLSASQRDRYRRQVDTDPNAVMRIDPPPAAMREHCARRIEEALSLLHEGYPELHAELHAILREVVIAVSPEVDLALEFDGASSFLLWGSIALNAQGHETRLDTVEALVHESAHCLLFGLSNTERLLENDNQPRYRSPLRVDPRPLDGIFHAAFVTARMHHALATLLERGVLRNEEVAQAEHSLAQHTSSFCDGVATLRRHALLTSLGRTVLEGMLRSMPA